MALEDILEKMKQEYQDSINSYNATKADLQKLESIKTTINYSSQIAELNLKLLAFSDPLKFKEEEFALILAKKPSLVLGQLLILVALISASLVMGGFMGLTLASFLTLILVRMGFTNIKKINQVNKLFHNIIEKEYYEDLDRELAKVKAEEKELMRNIKDCQNTLMELEAKIKEYFNAYDDISKINQIKNPLKPFPFEKRDETRSRVLKYER